MFSQRQFCDAINWLSLVRLCSDRGCMHVGARVSNCAPLDLKHVMAPAPRTFRNY